MSPPLPSLHIQTTLKRGGVPKPAKYLANRFKKQKNINLEDMNELYKTYIDRVHQELKAGGLLSSEEIVRYSWGTDAGFYRLIPQVVGFPKNEKELQTLIRCAHELKLPVTFRAAV